MPWWIEIRDCDHCNANVQEKRKSYMHPKAHCGQNVEAMAHQRWKGERQRECQKRRKTTLAKVKDRAKEKGKGVWKGKDENGKKKETCTCNHCGMKGHIKLSVVRKILHKCLRNSKARATRRPK